MYKTYNIEKLSFIAELLLSYGLIETQVTFENKALDFSHLDIVGTDYETRVNDWLDFVTTLYVMFDREPIIITENKGIPSVRHILANLFYDGKSPSMNMPLNNVPDIEWVN